MLGSIKQRSMQRFWLQSSPAWQLPQLMLLPHEFVIVPQVPIKQRGTGQLHWLLALQIMPFEQEPQSTLWPQALVIVPH